MRLLALAVLAAAAWPQTTTSVWDGVYTAAQAKRGADVYAKACASCHGDQLEGAGQAPPLSGSGFTGKWDKQEVDDLFETIQTTMPADKPGSLKRAQNADVLAYIFQMNQFPPGPVELPPDAEGLKKIRITAKK
jgi:quinoprotein glucose dehydrogenase